MQKVHKKRPELALVAPALERSATMVWIVVHRHHSRVFLKNNRKTFDLAKKLTKIIGPLWNKRWLLSRKAQNTMAKKTPKPPEFLTIYLLDDPELKSLVISLNRPLTEAVGAIFLLWALAVEAEAHQNEWILGMSWQEIDDAVGIPGFCDAMVAVKWMKKLTIAGIGAVQILKITKKPKPKPPAPFDPDEEQLTEDKRSKTLETIKSLSSFNPLSLHPLSPTPLSPSFLSPTTPLYTPPHSTPLSPTPLSPFIPPHSNFNHKHSFQTLSVNQSDSENLVSAKSGQKSSCFALPQNGVVSIKKSFLEQHPEIHKSLGSGDERYEELKEYAARLCWLFVNQYKGYGLYNRHNFFKANIGTIFEIIRLKVSPVALKYEILSDTRDKSEPVFKLSERANKFMIDPKFNSYNDVELDYTYHYGKLEDSEDPNGWVCGLETELERHLGVQKQQKTV